MHRLGTKAVRPAPVHLILASLQIHIFGCTICLSIILMYKSLVRFGGLSALGSTLTCILRSCRLHLCELESRSFRDRLSELLRSCSGSIAPRPGVSQLRGEFSHILYGPRRGASWRVFEIVHSAPHSPDMQTARPQIMQLHEAVTTAIGQEPMILCPSGAPGVHNKSHVLVKVATPM